MDHFPMRNQALPPKNPQSGSIFIWIFVMIALFAALSFALTQGLRGGASTFTTQEAKIAAQEILDYGRVVRDGFRAMRIDGIPLREIDIRMQTLNTLDGNPYPISNNNCVVTSCQLFNNAGGKIPERQFYEVGVIPNWWGGGWAHPGGVVFSMINISGIGTTASDVVMHIMRINETVCHAVNTLNNISTWPTIEDVTGENFYTFGWAVDASLAATDAWTVGLDYTELANKTAFCWGDSTGGDVFILMEAR